MKKIFEGDDAATYKIFQYAATFSVEVEGSTEYAILELLQFLTSKVRLFNIHPPKQTKLFNHIV